MIDLEHNDYSSIRYISLLQDIIYEWNKRSNTRGFTDMFELELSGGEYSITSIGNTDLLIARILKNRVPVYQKFHVVDNKRNCIITHEYLCKLLFLDITTFGLSSINNSKHTLEESKSSENLELRSYPISLRDKGILPNSGFKLNVQNGGLDGI